jgi:hypothetical protein
VTKPGGGERRLVRLDPADELRWACSVAAASPRIRRCLGGESHASRVGSWHPSRGLDLEPWRPARRRWSRELRRLAHDAGWVAVTDVRACYPSIGADVVVDRLLGVGVSLEAAAEIGSWLWAFREDGVEGLPVGPTASAVLADAVLSLGDDAIRSAGASHLRWVDDVVIFAGDHRTGIRALDALRRSWRGVGLDPHEGKTAIITGRDAVATLSAGRHVPSLASAALR